MFWQETPGRHVRSHRAEPKIEGVGVLWMFAFRVHMQHFFSYRVCTWANYTLCAGRNTGLKRRN